MFIFFKPWAVYFFFFLSSKETKFLMFLLHVRYLFLFQRRARSNFFLYEQVVYAQLRIRPGEWDTQTSLKSWDTNGSPNLGHTTKPCDSQQKNRTCRILGFTFPANHRVKFKKYEERDKYLDLARKLKKIMEPGGNGGTNCSWRTWNNLQRFDKVTGRLRNQRTTRDHSDQNITKIGQNTEKSPWDLKKFAIN